MTPAEAARHVVELQVDDRLARIGLRFDTREDYDTARHLLIEAYTECHALRERVERAEKAREEWCILHAEQVHAREVVEARLVNQAERIRYLEGATNHATGTPLSRAITERDEWRQLYQGEQDRREAAEADVARLWEALQKITTITDRHWPYTSPATDIAREALAATRPPERREGGA